MQLKSIKLVGFKSFVDPTTIHIKAGMNGIVGPNGCGKSNIIDAVRWVIGERSAKQLRGQSMSDVIFNGTSGRKPVGRASVDLCFDNSDGSAVGEYAKFSEIVVKREVYRDGQSSYFLNGTKCRRQDIVDLFYGTGLGSRSYAIIEQGMISRLIEAKPEDLRDHIEEAAGIAKYKQRRRDTENRMGRTEENLSRLLDIRDELEKQLRHLKRQANSAERYKVLREEERQVNAEIKALQWKDFEQTLSQHDQRIQSHQVAYDRVLSTKRETELEIEKVTVSLAEATDQHQAAQRDFYAIGADVARLEQRIHDTQSQFERWQRDLDTTNERWQELSDSTGEYTTQIEEIRAEIEALKPHATQYSHAYETAVHALEQAEQAMNVWSQDWDAFQQSTADLQKGLEVNRTQLRHFEQSQQQIQARIEKLEQSRQPEEEAVLRDALHPLEDDLEAAVSERTAHQVRLNELQAHIQQQKQHIDQCHQTLNEKRHVLQAKEGRAASLKALQEAAYASDDQAVTDWLTQQGINEYPRLGKDLRVEPGWEVAVETVLKGVFDAVGVDQLDPFIEQFSPLDSGELVLVESWASTVTESSQFESLASRVQSEWPVDEWLGHVFIADTLEQAKQMRSALKDYQSIVTRDGVWVGKHWLRVAKRINNDSSVLLREKELEALQDAISSLKNEVFSIDAELAHHKSQLGELESQREQCHREVQRLNDLISQHQSSLTRKQSQLDALIQRHESIQADLTDCVARQAQLKQEVEAVEQQIAQGQLEAQQSQQQRESLMSRKGQLSQQLQRQREQTQAAKQRMDEYGIRLSSNENQVSVLEQTLQRDHRQLGQLTERRDELANQLGTVDSPLSQLQQELQSQLQRQSTLEQTLTQASNHLESLNQRALTLQQARETAQVEMNDMQAGLQQLHMDRQAVQVRQATIAEQLESAELDIATLIEQLSSDANLSAWTERSEALASRITRLGPINLAAIEEHDTLLERKTYIDKQHADLQEALETLHGAIRKIDKETRSKFKETYDKVNTGFQTLFPKIFGGGQASIEMDAEDLLTAGVIVKAQPPGKRNATIHMLSGGEKALTAIALVFSLFQLNPAPFCILDEVDAPLDDLNVGRYCRLIGEMADQIQFIVISHNKVTIESCDRLMGITMQEPGVSRMVAVDIDEAVSMAEA